MTRRPLLALLAAAVLLPVASAPAQQRPAPAQRDWTRSVATTPEGGFRMGNPAAPVKLVEYFSLTCPHCADFSREGTPQLIRDYVRGGRVSLEYRNFVLNGLDLAAALISRCATPQNYFPLNHAILASQQQWMNRFAAASDEERQALQGLALPQQMQRVAALSGLDGLAARHGVTADQARACLSDQAGIDRLLAMQDAGSRAGVNGTPSFAINGRIVQTNVWAGIEPLLRDR